MTHTTTDAAEARAREALAQACENAGLRASSQSIRSGQWPAVGSHPAVRAMLAFATAEAASGAAYPDNTYTPYGRRSVRNLAKQLNLAEENPTVVSVINKASDEITFLRALATASKAGSKSEAASKAGEREALLAKALQRISAEPLHSLPIVTTQRMRNIADFALLGEDLA